MRVSTADLRDREYWTPPQAARVLGKGADFWREACWNGWVRNRLEGRRRYLNAMDARDFLDNPHRWPLICREEKKKSTKELLARWRAGFREPGREEAC